MSISLYVPTANLRYLIKRLTTIQPHHSPHRTAIPQHDNLLFKPLNLTLQPLQIATHILINRRLIDLDQLNSPRERQCHVGFAIRHCAGADVGDQVGFGVAA